MVSKRSWMRRPKRITADADQRRGNQAEQGKPPIHAPHHADQKERGEEGLGEVHDAGAEHHADGVEIVGGARHDVAGAVFRVEVLRERDDMGEQIVAQIELDVARQADEDDAHPILKNSLDHREQHDQRGEFEDQRKAKAFHQRIDAAADGQWQRGLHDIGQQQRAHAERHAAPVLPEIGPHRFDDLFGLHVEIYIPSQVATVFIHSSRKVLRPSRFFHQPSGVK